METPVIRHTRILTEEQIEKLSDQRLGAYRRKVNDVRRAVHEIGEAEEIRAFDYLANAIGREKSKRLKLIRDRFLEGEIGLETYLVQGSLL